MVKGNETLLRLFVMPMLYQGIVFTLSVRLLASLLSVSSSVLCSIFVRFARIMNGFRFTENNQLTSWSPDPLRGVYSDTTQHNSTQLNSTRQREQQLTQFVGRDIINKNTTELAVSCSTGSVEFSWVELSCVAIDTPLGYSNNSYCHW